MSIMQGEKEVDVPRRRGGWKAFFALVSTTVIGVVFFGNTVAGVLGTIWRDSHLTWKAIWAELLLRFSERDLFIWGTWVTKIQSLV